MIEEISEHALGVRVSLFEDAFSASIPIVRVMPDLPATILAQRSSDARSLTAAVTSKGGTTAAGLEQFDHEDHGVTSFAKRTVEAAASRSQELGRVT